jgi:uncharacterized membrane protein
MMDQLLKTGRYLLAVSIAVFGIQYLAYGRLPGGLPPVPIWLPYASAVAYSTGAFLVVVSLGLLTGRMARLFAILFGVFFLLCVLVQLFKLTDVWFHGTARTRALEPLALAGAAFALAGTLPEEGPNSPARNSLARALIIAGSGIFAFCMVIFGVQHFMYADFIATLIPAWMPARLFLAYFTGCAFIAAGVAIAVKKEARLASALLGGMFLLWVILLHAPRVAAAPQNGDELTSLFVALAMAGGSFIVSSVMPRR